MRRAQGGDVLEHLAQTLGSLVRRTTAAPPAARAAALRCVLDLAAAAVAGGETEAARAAGAAARAAWGPGGAPCWFSGLRLAAAGAAFANAASASALDLDDGHRLAIGHPGAAVIPAVLAHAEETGAGAERALTAIALGYEVAIRIGAARRRTSASLDGFATGLWCGQGVAAAIGWLDGLAAGAIAHGIAIAGSHAPNQAPTAYTRIMGNHVKEGIPWATATGMVAARLAAAGFTGPVDLLDDDGRYDRRRLDGGLEGAWLIEGVYFKPYGCCRWIHAPIDAVLALQAEHGIAVGDILAVDVHTFPAALALNNEVAPATLESAQYSVPFCVALAALRGAAALLPLERAALDDAAARELARRVRLHLDPRLEAMFPAAAPGRVVVTTRHGSVDRAVTAPLGEPANPMDWEALAAKLRTVAAGRMAGPSVAALEAAVRALGDGRIGPLLGVLGAPTAGADACPEGAALE